MTGIPGAAIMRFAVVLLAISLCSCGSDRPVQSNDQVQARRADAPTQRGIVRPFLPADVTVHVVGRVDVGDEADEHPPEGRPVYKVVLKNGSTSAIALSSFGRGYSMHGLFAEIRVDERDVWRRGSESQFCGTDVGIVRHIVAPGEAITFVARLGNLRNNGGVMRLVEIGSEIRVGLYYGLEPTEPEKAFESVSAPFRLEQ